MSQPTPPTRPATATEWRIDEVLMPGNFSPLHAVFTGMRAISLILGILAALGLLLGMIPFFGWLNCELDFCAAARRPGRDFRGAQP